MGILRKILLRRSCKSVGSVGGGQVWHAFLIGKNVNEPERIMKELCVYRVLSVLGPPLFQVGVFLTVFFQQIMRSFKGISLIFYQGPDRKRKFR